MTEVSMDDLTRRLGDSFAVALLQWPPLVAAMLLAPQGWALFAKSACFLWVALVGLSLVFGRVPQGPRWGLAMALCAGLVAASVALHGSIWMAGSLCLLLIAFHTALKIRLTETGEVAGSDLSSLDADELPGPTH